MAVLELLAASLIVAPGPTMEMARHIQENYPSDALRGERSAGTLVRVSVAPSGRAYRCDTVVIIGDQKLGKDACAQLTHLKFAVPRAADGTPAYGVMTTLIRYFLPDTLAGKQIEKLRQPADLTLTVATLPNGERSPLKLHVNAEISPDGIVTACEASGDAPGEYAAAACHELQGASYEVLKDENQEPVRYVTSLSVEFATDSQPSKNHRTQSSPISS